PTHALNGLTSNSAAASASASAVSAAAAAAAAAASSSFSPQRLAATAAVWLLAVAPFVMQFLSRVDLHETTPLARTAVTAFSLGACFAALFCVLVANAHVRVSDSSALVVLW